MLEFIFKTTNELSIQQKEQLCMLFYEVYNKTKTLEKFEKQFGQTILNYSYHGLMVDNEKIVGNYTAIPLEYACFGQKKIFALSVDTMIAKKYRGVLSNLKKMAGLVYTALIKDGIPFIYGFPNESFYLVKKRVLGWRDIGELDYYVLPIKIGAINNKMRVFNIFSMMYACMLTKISELMPIDSIKEEYPIQKNNDKNFLRYRYNQDYKIEIIRKENDFLFIYKIGLEHGVRIAYLIDVFPLNKQTLTRAVTNIFNAEKSKVDMIGYLGKLNSPPINLLKVPYCFESKTVKMSGKILIDNMIDSRIFDIKKWNVNLSNFDVR